MKKEDQAEAPEQVQSNSDPLAVEKILIAEEKTEPTVFLQFTGLDDLAELIKFTGKKPRISENMVLRIGKFDLVVPCLINCDNLGNVKQVLSPQDFEKRFKVIKSEVFDTKHVSRHQEKE